MELIVKNIPVLVLDASQVPNVMDNYAGRVWEDSR